MSSGASTGTLVRASLLALVTIAVFGGLLVLLEWGELRADGASTEEVRQGLSAFSQAMTPWVFLAAGFVAGLYLRSLVLPTIAIVSTLTNAYFFLLSLLFHALVGGLTASLLLVQLQAFLLGLVLMGITLGLGGLTEVAKERWGLREGG